MSAPTLAVVSETDGNYVNPHGKWVTLDGGFDFATPADVRLWLLDQGATERQWCEHHEGFPLEHERNSLCRMVSVLVWNPDQKGTR